MADEAKKLTKYSQRFLTPAGQLGARDAATDPDFRDLFTLASDLQVAASTQAAALMRKDERTKENSRALVFDLADRMSESLATIVAAAREQSRT